MMKPQRVIDYSTGLEIIVVYNTSFTTHITLVYVLKCGT